MKRWTTAFSYAAILTALLLFGAACTKMQVAKEEAPSPVESPVKRRPKKPVVEEIAPPALREVQVSEAPAPKPSEGKEGDAEVTAAQTQAEPAAGLQTVYFDFDKAVITTKAQETLKKNRDYLLANPVLLIVIEGHCDERGTNEYNLVLGERRAAAARRFLADLGVDPDRMEVISYGEERPTDPAGNEAAWSENRRAEFKKR